MAKTGAARKPRTSAPKLVDFADTQPEVVRLKRTTPDSVGDLVPLFELDGTTFYAPKRPALGIGMRFLVTQRKRGSTDAALEMLETLIGEDAFNALLGFPELTEDDLSAVIKVATSLVLGKSRGDVVPPNPENEQPS